MLEKILDSRKKKVLPLVLGLLLAPSQVLPYTAMVDNQLVEVDEKNKIIQIETKDGGVAKKSGVFSFIEHQRVLLKKYMKDIDYSTYQAFKEAKDQSKYLAKQINKIKEWFPKSEIGKVGIWDFFSYGLWNRISASREVQKHKFVAGKYLTSFEKEIEKSHIKTYQELVYQNKVLKSAKSFLDLVRRELRIRLPWNLSELARLPKDLKRDIHYLDLGDIEETLKDTINRIKKALKDEQPLKDHKKRVLELPKKEKLDPYKEIRKFQFRLDPPKKIFRKEYELSVYNKSGQELPSKRGLEIIIERTCQKDDKYHLRIQLLTHGWKNPNKKKSWEEISILDRLKTKIFLFYPSTVDVGTIDQSAQLVRAKKGKKVGKFTEILTSKRDDLIINLAEYFYRKSLHNPAIKGNIMRWDNIVNFGFQKLEEFRKLEESAANDLITSRLKGYSVREINLAQPTNQATAYVISIPLENLDQKNLYVRADIHLSDWYANYIGNKKGLFVEIDNSDMPDKKDNLTWVIPSEWIRRQEDSIEVMVKTKMEKRTITPNDSKPEFIRVPIVDKEYLLLDQEYLDRYTLSKITLSVHPVALSPDTHFQKTPKRQLKGNYVPGIYFGEIGKISPEIDIIRKERKKRNLPVMPNPFYGTGLGGILNMMGFPGAQKGKYITPDHPLAFPKKKN